MVAVAQLMQAMRQTMVPMEVSLEGVEAEVPLKDKEIILVMEAKVLEERCAYGPGSC